MDRDYISPGLSVIVPDASFPHLRVGNRATHPWKYLRREIPHHWYADERFPFMGFMNRDEAAILYNLALQFAGQAALEIGGCLGWSTCHLALAGVRLDVIDPAHADPVFRSLIEQSIARCGVSATVHLTARRSPEGVHELAAERSEKWNLFVIDGDHEGPAAEQDVYACLPYAHRDCAFLFHDLASPAVAAGLRVLQHEGFQILIYQTQQIMGIAWRGKVTPIEHVPDPEVAWQLPHHLVGLPVSGADFEANWSSPVSYSAKAAESTGTATSDAAFPYAGWPQGDPGLARDTALPATIRRLQDEPPSSDGAWRPVVCIVSNEIIDHRPLLLEIGASGRKHPAAFRAQCFRLRRHGRSPRRRHLLQAMDRGCN